ncbi:MAG: universal stress protein, partial [Cyclobacteriaceae bacterium]
RMFVYNFFDMSEILCVIDFTESSGTVLEVGARIAYACKAHLIVLFPYRLIDYGYRGDMGSLKFKLEAEAREKFHDLQKSIPTMETPTCEFHPEIGFIADRINSYVRKNKIDMVIVGQEQTVNTKDVKEFNLQHLIADSKVPFVIVPAEAKHAVAII